MGALLDQSGEARDEVRPGGVIPPMVPATERLTTLRRQYPTSVSLVAENWEAANMITLTFPDRRGSVASISNHHGGSDQPRTEEVTASQKEVDYRRSTKRHSASAWPGKTRIPLLSPARGGHLENGIGVVVRRKGLGAALRSPDERRERE